MKKKNNVFKKLLSLLLVAIITMSAVPFTGVKSSAASSKEEAFVNKIEYLKKKYPHGKYWNKYNGTEKLGSLYVAKAGNKICQGSRNGSKCATKDDTYYCPKDCNCLCGEFYGGQCFGFANLMAYYTMGSYAISNPRKGAENAKKNWVFITEKKIKENKIFYAGDVVRINGNHSIFVY